MATDVICFSKSKVALFSLLSLLVIPMIYFVVLFFAESAKCLRDNLLILKFVLGGSEGIVFLLVLAFFLDERTEIFRN